MQQIDLPPGRVRGRIQAVRVFKKVEDIEIVYFSEKDVVRYQLVQDVIWAYEKYNGEGKRNKSWA